MFGPLFEDRRSAHGVGRPGDTARGTTHVPQLCLRPDEHALNPTSVGFREKYFGTGGCPPNFAREVLFLRFHVVVWL